MVVPMEEGGLIFEAVSKIGRGVVDGGAVEVAVVSRVVD